jgi:ABC-type multidrug transport system ATPase subunit
VTPLSPSDLIVHELSDEGGKRLTSMSFVQRKGTVVAVLGPSGAGKSSLFKALLGELEEDRRPSGSLFFRQLDLRRSPAQLRTMLGFVPQRDDMHGTLTLRTMLRYADRLRSGIAHHGTRDRRITRLCRELGIDKRLDHLVGKLSGGQAKRASIALEMLSQPALLMLDEPTSGLDPNMDREVMTILRRYAENGRTVVVITHNVQHLRLAHRVLVVASQGRPVYFGPPSRVRQTLGVKTYADLMKLLTDEDQETAVAGLAERYRSGAEAREAGREAARALHRQPDPARRVRQPSRALTVVRQLSTLLRRQAALIWAQRHRTDGPERRDILGFLRGLGVVLMPLIIAAVGATLAIIVSTPDGFGLPSAAPRPGPGPAAALSLLTTLSMLNGQALTYSNVVSEWPVIRREYRTGIVPLSVLLAKWLVFAVLAVVQSAIVVLVFTGWRPAPVHHVLVGSGRAELTLDLAALTVASMTLGLLISVLARRLEQAVVLTTGVSIAQIALNGVTADLSANRLLSLPSYLLPSRWGLAACASSVDLRHIQPKPFDDAMWNATTGQYGKDLFGLLALTAGGFLAAAVLLHRRLGKPDR